MRLEIHNINKIKEAKLSLNGLTVIVGENDTGKSTIGRAFFSTIKAVSNMRKLSKVSSAEKAKKHIDSLYRRLYGGVFVSHATMLLPRSRMELEKQLQDSEYRASFLSSLSDNINSLDLSPRQKSLIHGDLENIRICFDEVDNPSAVLATELSYQIESEFMGQFCSTKSKGSSLELETDEKGIVSFTAKANQIADVHIKGRDFYEDITYVESPLYVHLLDSLRTSVAYRETRRILGNGSMVPAHVKDFVDKILSIQNFSGERNIQASSEKNIDTEKIINGSFSYDKNSRSIIYLKDGLKVKPINVASGIKSFGALQMLLDGYCLSNNCPLIWDEPENHLHPQWQVEFAKVLVQIVHSGVPVMISTHSPYFLQAVRYYSAMYDIEKYVNYYMADSEDTGMVVMKEVTDDLNEVFVKLAVPLNQIMNVDEVRGKMK